MATHLRQGRLDLPDQVFVEEDLVKDIPKANAFLTDDLDQSIAALISARVQLNLLLEEFYGPLVEVVAQRGHATVAEKFNLVVEFEYLRVLLLAELVAIRLVWVVLLSVVVIVLAVIVVIKVEVVVVVI